MSQCVLRWRARVAGLGLLAAVVALAGVACTPPQDLQPAAQGTPPTITVLSPTTDLTIYSGAYVEISWTDFDGSGKPQVRVFYDTDNDPATFQTLTIIDETAAGAPDRYSWNTAGVPAGTYYVGAQISDGTNTDTSYAIGRVTIIDGTTVQQMDLGQIGVSYRGCIFEGFGQAGRLGAVMAGRFDINGPNGVPDGIDDFILIAPQADSHYIQDPEVGEGYIVFGQAGAGGSWYTGTRFNVNSIGTHPSLPGAIIVGPGYITQSLGITAVMPLADVDNDDGSELMFGTPLLVNGRYEDQDYDPIDADNLPPFSAARYAYPTAPTGPDPDQHDIYGGRLWSTGYITVLSSTSPLFDANTGLGAVIHIDEIGQVAEDRVINPRTRPGIGVRVYPFARLVNWFDFLNNDVRFGSALGSEDIDGDGAPDWFIASPGGVNGAGEIDIGYASLALLWTDSLPGSATCYSWPYMEPVGTDRRPVWPFGLIDRLRGDELGAPNGGLTNPTGLGDFNDDGLGDIAASTPSYSKGGQHPDTGAAYLVFGRAPFGDHDVGEIDSTVVLNALPGIYIEGGNGGDRFGDSMVALGRPNYGKTGFPRLRDFNADTLADWVISAPGYDRQTVDVNGNPETRENAGAIAIVFGDRRKDGRFTWDQIGTDDLPGVIITGTNRGDEFGKYMALGGDINGDGADDLLVAAPGAENPLTGAQDAGTIYVIYGPSNGADVSAYQALRGIHDIETLMAEGPIRVRAFHGAVQGMRVGPVAGAGDIDGDGFEDILIGNPFASPLGRTNSGEVYVVFGSQY